jgi:hypothetical protein
MIDYHGSASGSDRLSGISCVSTQSLLQKMKRIADKKKGIIRPGIVLDGSDLFHHSIYHGERYLLMLSRGELRPAEVAGHSVLDGRLSDRSRHWSAFEAYANSRLDLSHREVVYSIHGYIGVLSSYSDAVQGKKFTISWLRMLSPTTRKVRFLRMPFELQTSGPFAERGTSF